MDRLEGARVLVVGLGRSGRAAVKFLRHLGAQVWAADVRPLEELPGVEAELQAFGVPFMLQSEQAFRNKDLIVVSPGVPADLPELEAARRSGVPVWGEVELAARFLKGSVIGITGTNGKTTTTSLVGHILKQAGLPVHVGGNIGVPVVEIAQLAQPGDWAVLELSSFQLVTTESLHAKVAVVLNVTPDHLDWHRSWEAYVAAKRRLIELQNPQDPSVLNADDEVCRAFGKLRGGATVWFSARRPLECGWWVEDGRLFHDGTPWLEVKEIPLRGRHNWENVLAAAAASERAGARLEQIAEAVRCFAGVEHRLEFVARIRGVEYYNDSKATNVDAAIKAVEAFDSPLWIILGGKDKDGDYRPLGRLLRDRARGVLLIGAAANKIASQIGHDVPCIHCGTLDRAVAEASARAQPGEVVLLAPACASFDQFQNFEERGRKFKELVRQLEEQRCD